MLVCGPPGFGVTWPGTHSHSWQLPELGLVRGRAGSLGPASPSGPTAVGGRGRAHRACPAQSLMLAKAKECWEQEHEAREAEKSRYLAERIPALQTRGLSLSALQVGMGQGLPKRRAAPRQGLGLARPQALSLAFTAPWRGVGLGWGVGSHFTSGKGASAGRRGLLAGGGGG